MLSRSRFLFGIFTYAVLLFSPLAWAQEKAKAKPADAAGDSRSADKAAIAEVFKSLGKAFAGRDAQAVAAHWTTEGEYENQAGVSLKGKDAIANAFASFFAKTPEVKSEAQPGVLRFLAKDAAVSEGKVTVQRGPTVPATTAKYTAFLMREDGKWRLAKLSESASEESSLQALSWLEGEWKSAAGEKAEIRTIYSWSPNRKFLHANFTIKEKEKGISLSGQQIIGIHPATRELHSWIFEADGGVGEGEWQRDDDHWTVEASGTLVDGSELSQTNILRRINDDLFTWQSVYRSLDGKELADLPPVKVTRVKSEK